MKSTKKLLSLLLVFVMVFSLAIPRLQKKLPLPPRRSLIASLTAIRS